MYRRPDAHACIAHICDMSDVRASQECTHAFPATSPRSYLTGNQLNSDSGTKTITTCLRKGCRVIELDVYNQQPTFSGPVCKHGGTLTKPVAFKVRDPSS